MLQNLKSEIETVDFLIGGKMLVCSAQIDNDYATQVMSHEDKSYIKERLASQIAMSLIENSMIEFTQKVDRASNKLLVHGRIFVTPDAQTKIIRTLKR